MRCNFLARIKRKDHLEGERRRRGIKTRSTRADLVLSHFIQFLRRCEKSSRLRRGEGRGPYNSSSIRARPLRSRLMTTDGASGTVPMNRRTGQSRRAERKLTARRQPEATSGRSCEPLTLLSFTVPFSSLLPAFASDGDGDTMMTMTTGANNSRETAHRLWINTHAKVTSARCRARKPAVIFARTLDVFMLVAASVRSA